MNDINTIMDWITNQGFAVAVAGYLLIRLEQKIDKLISLVEKVIEK